RPPMPFGHDRSIALASHSRDAYNRRNRDCCGKKTTTTKWGPIMSRISFTLGIAVSLFTLGLLHGQTAATGQIAGTVFDPSNAAVAGADVTVQSSGTAISRKVTTDQTGSYTISLLPPGSYSLTVTAKGFKTQTTPSVTVNVTETSTVRVQLELGQTTE